ncbi:MAG: hypothetical protein AAFP69_13920, partial [Planctomycetota bacterium]
MLAIATITILMLTAMLFRYQNKLNVANSQDKVATPESIAQITGLRGALIWTGDRGEIVQDISVGTQLAGGTILVDGARHHVGNVDALQRQTQRQCLQ